jgi:hypothetical protein
MPVDISFRPTRVLIDGHVSEGKLILADGQLAALIVRLDGEHHTPEHRGCWHLEPRLGKCAVSTTPLFWTPEEAGDRVRQRLIGALSRLVREVAVCPRYKCHSLGCVGGAAALS